MPTTHCACGAKYRFDESVIGKKARCKKCGRVFTIAPDADDGPIPIASDDPFAAEMAAAAQRTSATPSESTHDVDAIRATVAGPTPPLVDEPKPSKGYGGSLLWTFLFVASPGNLISFLVMWVVLVVAPLLPCILTLLAVGLWYAAFRFAVIESAASGEEDLPNVGISGGIYEDFVVPGIKWMGSWIVVLLPAYVYLIVAISQGWISGTEAIELMGWGLSGLLQGATGEMTAFLVLVYGGLFLWPMVVLCVGLGGFESLYRLDLIIVTIVRTFPVYLLTVGMVFGSVVLEQVLVGALGLGLGLSQGAGTGNPPNLGRLIGNLLLLAALARGVSLYFEIVAMRVIGLYYHHFKHRFAWSWG